MTNYTFDSNKSYSTTNPKKKAYRIADKTIIVIDTSLVKRLSITEDSWFEQEATEEGILLRISHKSKGMDVN